MTRVAWLLVLVMSVGGVCPAGRSHRTGPETEELSHVNHNTVDFFEHLHVPLMRELFHDPDCQATRAVYAGIAAHGLPNGPPVWVMAVAPPGSAKTTTLDPLDGLLDVHAIDKLTINTFLSGQIVAGPRPPSLLHRIGTSGIVTFADFSTVLGMRPDDKTSILADLRRIFDGHLHKEVGTSGEALDWKGRLTLTVAVTPDVDRHYGVFQALGERFVMVRWQRAGGDHNGEAAAMSAMAQDPVQLRETLRHSVDIVFDGLPADVSISHTTKEHIAALAEFTVRARTHVARDSSHSKNLIYLPEPEAPTRLAQQLSQLARGSARLSCRTSVDADDLGLVRRVGFDCIPRLRWRVLDGCRQGKTLTADIPKATLSYVREDLRLVGLLTQSGDLSPLSRRLLARVGP